MIANARINWKKKKDSHNLFSDLVLLSNISNSVRITTCRLAFGLQCYSSVVGMTVQGLPTRHLTVEHWFGGSFSAISGSSKKSHLHRNCWNFFAVLSVFPSIRSIPLFVSPRRYKMLQKKKRNENCSQKYFESRISQSTQLVSTRGK